MKKIIIVTGGAGFIGSNLIELLLKKEKSYQIISLDNYSSGKEANHIFHKNLKYIKGDTSDFYKIFYKLRKKIKVIFHFGEFSRIYQSFSNIEKCFKSNLNGTNEVIKFCLNYKIRIIYSATSACLGNKQNDQNLSPYAFTKANNMNLIINLANWFKLKYNLIFFYNVYGPKQIKNSSMAAVIGIFESQYLNKEPLTVVAPGEQKRRFTHVYDTVVACYKAFKKGSDKNYSVYSKKQYSVMSIARSFSSKIKFLKERRGERFKSSLVAKIRGKKIYFVKSKIDIKKYIKNFLINS